jgi:hypothetical protein
MGAIALSDMPTGVGLGEALNLPRHTPLRFAAFVARAEALGMALRWDGWEYIITFRDGIERYTSRWILAQRVIEAAEAETEGQGKSEQ